MSDQPNNPTPKATPDQLRRFAVSMMEETAKLLKKADALERGEPLTPEPPVIDETDEAADAEETALHTPLPPKTTREAKAEQDERLRRQAWALYGQLVLKNYITPPNWYEIQIGEIVNAAYELSGVLADMEFVLQAIDQQAVSEFAL